MKKNRIAIVDEDDNIIGYKERGTLDPEDIYRVSALWLTNSKGEILIAQRSFNKDHNPGQWGTSVAGTVDEGESYEENIIKEAEEEIGLKGVEFKEGPHGLNRGEHNYFYQWYLATVDMDIEDFEIDKEEVEAIRWISKEQLLKEIKESPEDFLITMDEWIRDFS